MVGEDMACYLQKIPGFFFFLNTCDPVRHTWDHHSPRFDMDETYIWRGSALLSAMALKMN
jgi:metal-dependent amidase/aminoacylase/carboxypeptidase family protein